MTNKKSIIFILIFACFLIPSVFGERLPPIQYFGLDEISASSNKWDDLLEYINVNSSSKIVNIPVYLCVGNDTIIEGNLIIKGNLDANYIKSNEINSENINTDSIKVDEANINGQLCLNGECISDWSEFKKKEEYSPYSKENEGERKMQKATHEYNPIKDNEMKAYVWSSTEEDGVWDYLADEVKLELQRVGFDVVIDRGPIPDKIYE
ncbi:MAG: hypothetical protein B6U87_03280, partial [Candidatus Aenigmarchaeota archaeon ex4484_52]